MVEFCDTPCVQLVSQWEVFCALCAVGESVRRNTVLCAKCVVGVSVGADFYSGGLWHALCVVGESVGRNTVLCAKCVVGASASQSAS